MIDTAALGFALGAGLVAALNPCGFAFLPGYLGLVITGSSQQPSKPAALARAAAATVAMSAGFLTVFGLFGLVLAPLLSSVQRYLPFATVVIGVALVGLGVWLLTGRELSVLMPRTPDAAPTARLRSMYGYGIAYAVASLSCTIAPFLAVISTTFKQGSVLTGVLAFVAYAAGMAITVGVAAFAVALAGASATGTIRRILPHVPRIAGAVVVLTGLYVAYYGYYEIRLFFADGDPDDPIIAGAGAVQGWLARQVDALGPGPLAAVSAVLAAVAVLWWVRTRRRRSAATSNVSAR